MLELNYKQVLSIVLTVIVYSYLINYNFAFAAVLAIGFHEAGHLWIAKRLGYQTGGLYIWPFIGGTAFVNDTYKSYNHKVIISLMGPLWGAGLATVIILLGYHMKSSLLLSVGFWMSFMNAFNLLPLAFLDGGQVLEAYTYSLNKKLGIVASVISTLFASVIFLKFAPFLMVLLLIWGISNITNKISDWNVPGVPYQKLSLKQGVLNLVFILFVSGMLYFNFKFINGFMTYSQAMRILIGG